VNVYPEKVCELVKRHPLVSTAAVRPYRTKDGMRLKAFVVPRAAKGSSAGTESHHAESAEAPSTGAKTDTAYIEQQLRELLSTELESAARPVLYTFGTELPRNELGKMSDWRV